MKTYLNQADRSVVLKLIGCLAVIEEAEERKHFPELFGKESWGDLKRGKAFIRRALQGLAYNLDVEQNKKIVNMSKSHDLVLVGRAAPHGKSECTVEVDKLYDIAELAIDNHCSGCEKQDHKSCRVYKVLSAADIPPADTVTTAGCPYRQ